MSKSYKRPQRLTMDINTSESRRHSRRAWFADEVPGGQLTTVFEVQCLKAEFAPELWSKSLCPLWSCSECTLVNEKPDALACILCGTPRWENDTPMEYLDRIALRTSRGSRSKEMRTSVKPRAGTPSRRSSPLSTHAQGRPESGSVLEKPELPVKGFAMTHAETNAKMSGPQVSAASSAIRALSAIPASRHRTGFNEAAKLKKDSPEQRAPPIEMTEAMVESVYATQLGSRRAARALSNGSVSKVLGKSPSPFRRLDIDPLDLPPIGSSLNSRIPSRNNQYMIGSIGPEPHGRRPGSSLS
eukprot:gnl/MRDRNA2_/MRDRNA2_42966_c0_seq1.p1 gnl/MRDRNA2_/MRDRNA2_42966_c0~~gnl/MRDRNA2_/MRDRNA2_42966_c0_seq1.p1  ORF type:complete len:300 (+),score=33.32 gnl/MRDRNA2_/MRDRNA2_42966_c0_seq1:45-944(+)